MNQISTISIFLLLLFSQCYSRSKENSKYSFPESYSLDQMVKINLSQDLEEISGLEWINETALWAIEDESSIIFEINSQTGKIIRKQKFAKNKDIEDILMVDEEAWVLQSNGNIYQVENPFTEYSNTTIYDFEIKGKRDFEAIIKVKNEPEILIFCKVCSWDKNASQASVYSFNLDSMAFDEKASFVLENKQLKDILKEEDFKEVKMQPSAIALHPIENRYYMLSSSDKWLMVLDTELKPLGFYHLNPRFFKQPEGIAFGQDGTMFISNEANDGNPNLLIFQYHP